MSLGDSRADRRRREARHSGLVALMALSMLAVLAVGMLDEGREAEAALRDLEREQAQLAALVAAGISARLEVAPRPDVARLLAGSGGSVLLRPPGDRFFYAAAGARFDSRPLRAALDGGRSVARLTREEAAALGLPRRVAIVGTAWTDAGPRGRWGVAAVASAGPERDRQTRARWRLVIGVTLAGGLVLALGGYGLRAQRKELELLRELAVADLGRELDQQLEREGRAATMLTLAAGVAHEISTPLSVIHGRAEQLLERARDERDVRGAQRILEQAARIEGVIRGFLGLARGDAPTLAALDPAEVAREAAALVEHRFAKADVRLTTDAPPGLPPVRGDRRLLEQAIVNLLLNACDACGRRGSVRLAVRPDAAGAVIFEVEDDGAGISPDVAARVAEPFFSTKAPGQGTGLGLAITGEIVKIHRGALALAPRAPRGTRVTVRVPTSDGGDGV